MQTSFTFAKIAVGIELTIAAAGAQAAPHDQHVAPPTSSAQPVPAKPMTMAGHADYQKMMEQMRQCHEMMSKMMDHMKHDGPMAKHPPTPPRQ